MLSKIKNIFLLNFDEDRRRLLEGYVGVIVTEILLGSVSCIFVYAMIYTLFNWKWDDILFMLILSPGSAVTIFLFWGCTKDLPKLREDFDLGAFVLAFILVVIAFGVVGATGYFFPTSD